MNDRPRILIVTPTYTHPADQGNSARIQAMGLHLKQAGFSVDVLFYVLDWSGDESAARMRACWDALHLVKAQPQARATHATCWGLDDWCPELLVEKVRQLQAANAYDAVIVNYVWLSRVFEAAGDALKILDTHDLFGDRHNLARRAGVEPNWFFTTLADENRGFDRADIVLAIQKDELRIVQDRTHSEAMLVSHPYLAHKSARGAPRRPIASFGYIGSSNPWNQLSVLQLDAALAGRGLDWLLAGRICAVPQRFASHPFIMGEIADVRAFYDAVECSLNPMVEATGLKIKTIEALAHDVPVIGTRAAFAGLDPEHPFHKCPDAVAVADAAAEFTADPSLREGLLVAGRKLFFDYMVGVETQYVALAQRISDHARNKRVPAA